MYITVVNFQPPGSIPLDDARAIFRRSADEYLDMPGLQQKYYLRSDDGETGGAVYIWDNRQAAVDRFTPEWIAEATEKYGAAPVISWFDAPVMVDVSQQEVRESAPQ